MTLEISKHELAETLLGAGIPDGKIFLGDEFYALPTADWVRKPFAREFQSILDQMRFTYSPERQDCENFAMLAAFWAQHFHAETAGSPESGLAFGELWVASQGHALNFAIHRGTLGSLNVAVYEPQPTEGGWSFKPRALTRGDFQTVWLAKA